MATILSVLLLASALLSGAVVAAIVAWLALALSLTFGWSARNWRIRGR